MKHTLILLWISLIAFPSLAQSTLKGYVFIDKNANGVRDTGEPGVKDVRVSDQAEIAITDANGAYTLNTSSNLGNIFVIQPDGYVVRGSFWKKIEGSTSYDFAL